MAGGSGVFGARHTRHPTGKNIQQGPAMRVWQFVEAKEKFEELISDAETGEPQLVAYEGEEVVVIGMAEYRRLLTQQSIVDIDSDEAKENS